MKRSIIVIGLAAMLASVGAASAQPAPAPALRATPVRAAAVTSIGEPSKDVRLQFLGTTSDWIYFLAIDNVSQTDGNPDFWVLGAAKTPKVIGSNRAIAVWRHARIDCAAKTEETLGASVVGQDFTPVYADPEHKAPRPAEPGSPAETSYNYFCKGEALSGETVTGIETASRMATTTSV